jgi:hypothetical protein
VNEGCLECPICAPECLAVWDERAGSWTKHECDSQKTCRSVEAVCVCKLGIGGADTKPLQRYPHHASCSKHIEGAQGTGLRPFWIGD